MPSDAAIAMIGLPGSGKTTYLAALWHQLEAAEIPTALTATKLQPDREYLNRIREAWLTGDVPNVPLGIDKVAVLHVRHATNGAEYDITIPDVPGEDFSAHWIERRVPAGYLDQIKHSVGSLLFVHCERVQQARLISPSSTASDAASTEGVDWDRQLAPTQVQLVDLVQAAVEAHTPAAPLRIAAMVSAWDTLDRSITPPEWLERNLPLLAQFLRANAEVVKYTVFGVSVAAPKTSHALTPTPSDRVRLYIESDVSRDLTLPIEFLTAVQES
jgi:hypothetical protein